MEEVPATATNTIRGEEAEITTMEVEVAAMEEVVTAIMVVQVTRKAVQEDHDYPQRDPVTRHKP